MESTPQNEPIVEVYEAPDGMLDVVIRTIGDDELNALGQAMRCAPRRAH